jgi:hypothetical protein
MAGCYGCEKGSPTAGPRTCPECGYVFRGNGWDGIDAHWKNRHPHAVEYKEFWASLCDAHRGATKNRRV